MSFLLIPTEETKQSHETERGEILLTPTQDREEGGRQKVLIKAVRGIRVV